MKDAMEQLIKQREYIYMHYAKALVEDLMEVTSTLATRTRRVKKDSIRRFALPRCPRVTSVSAALS